MAKTFDRRKTKETSLAHTTLFLGGAGAETEDLVNPIRNEIPHVGILLSYYGVRHEDIIYYRRLEKFMKGNDNEDSEG